MKKYLFWTSIILTLAWLSCEPPVIFKFPQPQGIQETSSFDLEFRGTYICESDSNIVVIGKKVIYKTEWFNFAIPQGRITQDESIIQTEGFIILDDFGKCTINQTRNDTVFASIQLADTLFLLDGKECILKSYKGHQILNLKLQDGTYEVIILSLDELANLELKMATLPGEVEKLEKITPVKNISTEDVEQYEINPTRLEFDEIFEQEIVFETCEYFNRVNIPNRKLYSF